MPMDTHTGAVGPQATVHRTLARWCWLLFAAFSAVFFPVATWFYFYSAPARSTGHGFVAALTNADSLKVFDLCSPTLQKSLGDEKGLQHVLDKSKNFYAPSFWTSVSVSGKTARLQSVGETLGREHAVTLHLERIGNDWRVSKFSSTGTRYDTLLIP